QSRQLHGTADWAEYRVTLPFDPKAKTVVVGSLLVGTGRVWADDLRLYVDGRPLADVPVRVPPRTILDTDTTFTAGSRVTLENITPAQLSNLVLLGKVWGFLKYHHPAIVAGKRQWDFDLFRVMPRVLAAKNAGGAQRAISAWIDSLGPVAACT